MSTMVRMIGAAADPALIRYYDRRAAEYDDWYLGEGLFADRHRPGWESELAAVIDLVAHLQVARTLDVACGTGFITRHVPGRVVGLDFNEAMLTIAATRVRGPLVRGNGLALPFRDGAFDRVFTAHFYGHLRQQERTVFLRETQRVGADLIVLDTARRADTPPEQMQERVLSDGSRHVVYKRFFTAAELVEELGAAVLLFEGQWFVVVRSSHA